MSDDQQRSPVDELVDLLVYAPVGLLYEYEEVIPKLVRRGKSQVHLAKAVGEMALGRGGTDSLGVVAEAVASMLARRITEIGASIGLAPPTGFEDEAATDGPAASVEVDEPVASEAEEPAVSAEADEPAAPVADEPADELDAELPPPIASYDTLTAREIIGLLDDLDPAQLARVRAHEEAGRARKTVLGKLDRLGA